MCCNYDDEGVEQTKEIVATSGILSCPQVAPDQMAISYWTIDVPVPYGYMWKYYNIQYITSNTVALQYATEVVTYSSDPIFAKQNVDRSIIIVQGSTGLRNINIAGCVQYQLVPFQSDMKMLQIQLPPACTFNPLEEYRLLLQSSQTTGVRCIYRRSDYVNFITHGARRVIDPSNVAALAMA